MSPASWFFNLSALATFMGVLSVFGFRIVKWSSGAVTLRGLPLIRRALCLLSYVPRWLPRMDSHHQHPASEAGVLLIELQGNRYPTEELKMVSAAGLAT